MFPMVATLEELRAAKAILAEEAQSLGHAAKLGVMIEVPSAALIAEALAPEIDFFSIGTNDLTQYCMAMDRGHPELAKQADALHPSVLKLIGLTVESAHRFGKWVGICGGLASDVLAIPALLGLGVDALSVSVPAIGAVIQLSRVLGSKTEGLLHGGAVVSEHLTICRSGEGMAGDQGDTEQSYAYSSLTRPGTAGHMMEPFLLSFDPATAQGVPITHDGQEFVYVVEGAIELFYDGRRYRLEQGASAYLDSALPHTFHGLGDRVAKKLAVVSS